MSPNLNMEVRLTSSTPHGLHRARSAVERLRGASRYGWPLLVFVLGLLLAFPLSCYRASQRIGPDFSTIDGSWHVELPMRLARGEIAGRDFVFTYGPLYQVLQSPWMFGQGGELGAVLRFHGVLFAGLIAIGLWQILRATGAPLVVRSFAYLLWFVLFSSNFVHCKGLLGLLGVAACGYSMRRPAEEGARTPRILAPLLWGAAVPLLTLYCFELGILGLLALCFFALAAAVWSWKAPGLAGRPAGGAWSRLALTIGGAALFAFAVSLPATTRHYLADSWEIARGYSTMMATPLSGAGLRRLLLGAAAGAILWLFAGLQWRRSRTRGAEAERRALGLLAAACFGLVWLRVGMTRSDPQHVRSALTPLLFVGGCLLPCHLAREARPLSWLAALGWIPLVALAPPERPGLAERLQTIARFECNRTTLTIDHPVVREGANLAGRLPEERIYVFPFECIVAPAAGKANIAYTVQSYVAHTPRLERSTIERLRHEPDAPVLFMKNAAAIDGVENLTRTPQLFRYLLTNYSLRSSGSENVLLLAHAAGRSRQWREQLLPGVEGAYLPGRPAETMPIPNDLAADCRASDVLSLRLRVSRTPMYGVGKPGIFLLTFVLSNGEERRQRLLLPCDGRAHDVLVSACTTRDPLFLSVFHSSRCWRSTECVVALRWDWMPLDSLSRRPERIDVERLSVLKPSGMAIVETPLADQHDASVREVFFGQAFAGKPPDSRR